VIATVPGVDPVGSCVGMRGLRIQNIVNELAGEKIDVIEWDTDVATYISNALSPAKVQSVLLDDTSAIKTATVVVPDRQLSLAIGKEGQNARLAAKLTGWRIDIKSESEARTEGIDELIADRAQQAAIKATEDLLAKAERILRQDGDVADTRLWQAAQSLREPTQEGPEMLPADFKPLEELIQGIEDKPVRRTIGDTPFELEELTAGLTDLADERPWPGVSEKAEGAITESPYIEGEAVAAGDELPQVITADMLRARRAKRAEMSLDDIDVPAELLAGYDVEVVAEDWVDDAERNKAAKAKGKAKGKGQPAKPGKPDKKKPKNKWEEDDAFARYR
jgi:transcription antitermination factor NusA-like protein